MPIYAMGCKHCEHTEDIYRTVRDMDKDLPVHCGETMERRITAPYVVADIQPYQSMCDGSWITSRSQHREHLKAHGVIELGNEKLPTPPAKIAPPPGLKDTLIRVANEKLKTA